MFVQFPGCLGFCTTYAMILQQMHSIACFGAICVTVAGSVVDSDLGSGFEDHGLLGWGVALGEASW